MLLVLALGVAAGCTSVNEGYTCTSSAQCTFQGQSGTCEPNGACSFPDANCASGRRYGEFSGPLKNVCVGAEDITDDDHDGVDDGHDNCKGLANMSQHDEDMDGYGDACDPCPPFSDGPTPDDPDGDGVSGKCDLEPGIANKIVSFQGFDVAPPAAYSTDGTGVWSYTGDNAKVDAENGKVGMLLFSAPGPQVAVITKLTIDALDTSGIRVAGTVDLFDVPGNHGTSCVAIRDPAGSQTLLLSDTLNSDSYGSVPMAVTAGITATISTLRSDATMTCANDTMMFTGTANYNPPGPKLGLRARGATVQFAWVLVVGR